LLALLGAVTIEAKLMPHINYEAYKIDLDKRHAAGELKDSDAFKSMCELAAAQNLECVADIEVTTEDGYILGVWRIPGPKGQDNSGRPPVML